MPALRIHHTATNDGAWDGPANEARLRNDGDEAYYRSAFAWQDPDGDPATKAGYRFVHHFVSGDGTVGAAATRAAIAGIGVLNGARGGTTIPDGDRQGVYNHLAAHLRDADIEPPELKGNPMDETKDLKLDLKQLDDEGTFEGDLSVYDVVDAVGDVVETGAFHRSLKQGGPNRPLLWQHDPRNPIGVLQLTDSEDALQVKGVLNMDLPQAREAHSIMKMFRKHGMNLGLSIGFLTMRDEVRNGIRYLKELKLFEGSLVTFPANRLCYVTDVKQMEGKDFSESLQEIQNWQIGYQIMEALGEALMGAAYEEGMTRQERITATGKAWDDAKSAYMLAVPGMFDVRRIKLIPPLTEKGREIVRAIADWAQARTEPEAGTRQPAGNGDGPANGAGDPASSHSTSQQFDWTF